MKAHVEVLAGDDFVDEDVPETRAHLVQQRYAVASASASLKPEHGVLLSLGLRHPPCLLFVIM